MKKRSWHKGFTLLEMLIVLLILSVLILLFVPNLAKQKETIDQKGNEAIVKVIEAQMELYELDKNVKPSAEQLLTEKYITKDQYEKYQTAKK
ncbi:competence type IV pilus major pilin ComGC [Melissococcus plutonius]|nr:competence type IV pilus major pilin ComGC [Melissococcus plutonius]BAL61835.1 late competence protein ComGC, access of DNA to ComEA [Melissococcus plutonius DAT561]AIM25211.1 late competence protein ComGC [Melissococcus plutonius S1]KMT23852.1 late competence protein ComGC [Melissococcus plutonius]KMT24375.1 late competence protein ComGC [Melissococcus plutonius]KMT25948.1 late competence protein ComGC [Melissococcus plutonius]